jgi:Mg-chelatase subunit ChlD
MRRTILGIKSCKVIIPILLLLLVTQFTLAAKHAMARQSKDIILVLDVSGSMIGQAGGKNIFDKVKQSVFDYIDQVEDGDRVTFATFETDVKIFPTVLVDDDNDRDILKKYMSMTEAKGLWTYTHKMIMKVLDEAKKLENEKSGRPTEIVVMTDAIDDPPPSELKKFNLKEFAEKYGKRSNLWIYILSFSNLKNTEAAKKLTMDISKITDKVKIIQTAEPEKGKEELISEEKKVEAEGRSVLLPIIIAALCILLLLAAIFFIKRLADLKVVGKLEYWNNEIIEPYIQRFDLARKQVREAVIGKGFGCTVNVRDINIKTPIVIKAIRHEGSVRMQLVDNESARAEMVNRQSDGLLQDGDIFKVGNYTFKYFAS